MNRILISTYTIVISNRKGDRQLIDKFNQTDDFFKFFLDFLEHILHNIQRQRVGSTDNWRKLTLSEPCGVIDEKRELHGYFKSGVTGDEYDIAEEGVDEEVAYRVTPTDTTFRELFFYCYIPKSRKEAYLAVQRKPRLGVKGMLEVTLNEFLKLKGYQDSRLKLYNYLDKKVFDAMMNRGRITQIGMITKRMNALPEDAFEGEGESAEYVKGEVQTILKSRHFPLAYKRYLKDLYKPKIDTSVELDQIDNELKGYDEIEFQLELDGKKKKFYIANRQRTQPDIDVTNKLEFNSGSPTEMSLIEVCRELILDMI